ncbi:MAG: BrnT family toxin [Deltaproteobacteria bacterium]|nr:BrnT family toxin [Deltaproteobacteria bacterium]
MASISFSWNEEKAGENLEKHKIPFEEAQTVFSDPNARMIFDTEHSNDEERFILLGISSRLRLLVVCHCYRENEMLIRIISARKATKKEQKQYGSFLL